MVHMAKNWSSYLDTDFLMQMNELLEINNVFVCKQNACIA